MLAEIESAEIGAECDGWAVGFGVHHARVRCVAVVPCPCGGEGEGDGEEAEGGADEAEHCGDFSCAGVGQRP